MTRNPSFDPLHWGLDLLGFRGKCSFVIDMATWMIAVWPAGWLADRIGRRPVIIAAWGAMTLRLVLVALAQEPWQVLAIEVLDGLAQSLFAIVAAS